MPDRVEVREEDSLCETDAVREWEEDAVGDAEVDSVRERVALSDVVEL